MTGKKPEKTGHCSCSTDQQYVNPSFEQDGNGGTGCSASTYNNRRSSSNLIHTVDGVGCGGGNNSKDCTLNDNSGCSAMHSNSTTHRKGHK